MSEPRFKGLHFWVRDLAKTLTFYRALGLDLGEPHQGEFLNVTLPGGVSFAFGTYGLTKRYDAGFEPPPAGKSALALQFDLESRAAVDDLYTRLVGQGHVGHLAPIDAVWGARYAEVCDPDGNVVGFHSPRE